MSRSFLTTKYAVIFHTSVQETNSLCAGSFVLSFLLPGVFKLQNNLCNLGQLLSINNRHLAVLPFNWPDILNFETFSIDSFSRVQNFGKNRQSSVLQSASSVRCPGAECILFCNSSIGCLSLATETHVTRILSSDWLGQAWTQFILSRNNKAFQEIWIDVKIQRKYVLQH